MIIYTICSEYNAIIIEDHYFMYKNYHFFYFISIIPYI